jgi:Skp family chaperone for outer membrane proteins
MRAVLWMSGVVVALAVVIGTSRLWAESKANNRAAPRTRIAIVNLTYVIKNYDKYKQFQEEMKALIGPIQKRDAELREQFKELRDKAEKLNKSTAKNEKSGEKKELEEKAREIQKQLTEIGEETKKKLAKRSDEEMKTLFKDVEEAARDYAGAHDIDLVLQYNDAITKEDYYSGQNIARKLSASGLMPLYVSEGMDISKDILDNLNKK